MKFKVAAAGLFVCLAAAGCGTAGQLAAQGHGAPSSARTATARPAASGAASGRAEQQPAVAQSARPVASTASSSEPGSAATAQPGSAPAAQGSAAVGPVVFDCLDHAAVRPGTYVLTCADYGSLLIRLSWTSWTAARATAVGVHELHDCTPSCAGSTRWDYYPAAITLWRPEPVPGHAGETYFSRVTVRYTTSARPPMYMSNGQLVQNPAQWTQTLGH